MIEILHYLEDPKLWELGYIFLIMGHAGFISSTLSPNPYKPYNPKPRNPKP